MKTKEGRILTRGFCFIAAANFLLFLSFYALMPVLPYFLEEVFNASNTVIGMVLASYSVACILIRPVSGWMMDNLRRRPVYLLAFMTFMLMFPCYPLVTVLGMVLLVRFVHGLAFGTATVAGTTIVTFLVPKSRLGEGLGLYGLANTVSMAVGPMFGLALHRWLDYGQLFIVTSLIVLAGLLMAAMVPVPTEKPERKRRLSFGTLFLVPALVPSLALLFASVPYGMTTTYISLLADEYGLTAGAGLFYTTMAVGLGVSRGVGGKLVDSCSIPRIILSSFLLVLLGYLVLTFVCNLVGFLSSAFIIGMSFGVVHPAFNTLFVKIGGESMRGTATSTYLTSWDTGIGLGILFAGIVAEHLGGYHSAFLCGILSVMSGIVIFGVWARNKRFTTTN